MSPLFPKRHLGPALAAGTVTLVVHVWIALRFPIDSFQKYPVAAELLAKGSLPPERWVDFSPFYLAWTRLLRGLFGSPEPAMVWAQILATALATTALFVLLDRHLGRVWAWVGAAAFTFERHVLIYERILEPEAILLFVVTGLLVLCDSDGRDGLMARPLAAGLLGAVGVAARPTLLPICLVLASRPWLRPLFAPGGPEAPVGKRAKLRTTALFLLPVLATVLLVAVQTRRATGVWGSPNMNPGTVFYEGNQPLSNGTSAIYPPSVSLLSRSIEREVAALGPDVAHAYYRSVARAADENVRSIAEVNGFWSSRIRAFAGDHPGIALRRIARKWLYMFHGFQWHDLPAAWVYDHNLRVPRIPFAVLSALALLGLLFGARRWHEHFVAYVFFAAQAGVMTLFYVSPRQRLVWVPVLIYFAMLALHRLKQEPFPRRLIAGLSATLLALCFAVPDRAMWDEKHQRDGTVTAGFTLAEISDGLRSGRAVATMRSDLAEALAAAPWTLDHLQPAYLPRRGASFEQEIVRYMGSAGSTETSAGAFDLAEMRLRAGDTTGARHLFEELAAEGAQRFLRGTAPELPEFFLGRIALREGDLGAAEKWLQSALQRSPGDPYVLAELFVLDGEASRLHRIARYFSTVDADRLTAEALLFHHRPAEALAALRRLVGAFPSSRPCRLMLAAALHRTGDDDEALEHLREADRIGPEPVLHADDMAALYAVAARRATTSTAVVAAARGLFHYGRPADARDLLLSEAHPQDVEGRDLLLRRLDETLAALQP